MAEKPPYLSLTVKVCANCNKTKPLEKFYFREDAQKHRANCKDCVKSRSSIYRKENAKLRNEYNRKYYRKQNTDRGRSRYLLQGAISSRKLIRKPCEVCGTDKNIQAHHEDYSKPLDVIWLCASHHGQRHRQIAKERRLLAEE